MRRLRGLAAAAALGGLAGCGSERPLPTSARPPLDDTPAFAAEAFTTPATFQYHPAGPAPLFARAALPDGSSVFAGERGERWLVESGKTVARSAAETAPEPLVAILPRDAGGFVFLGSTGTAYEAREPLGPFLRSSTPLEPIVRARAAGKALVGVRRDGTLVRSDTTLAAWTKVGPDGVRFEDIALGPDGNGLALAVPEALYRTSDFGASFQSLSVNPMGARSLSLDSTRAVVVNTILGSFRYSPGKAFPFEATQPAALRRQESLGASTPLGPSAQALVEGRALVLGDRYVEVRQERDGSFRLVRGVFGEALTMEPFPPAKGCVYTRLAGARDVLYLACGRQKPGTVTQVLDLYRSTDAGRTFVVEPYVAEGRMSELVMAASPDGGLIVSGVCPASAGGPGCRPVGVHVRTARAADSGPAVTLVPAATPALSTVALGIAFSYDGRTAFALGRRSKSDSLAVFVSHDSGATFEPRDIDSLTAPDDDDNRTRGRPLTADLESFAAAEDGTASFVVNRRGRRLWLVVDDDGRPLALSKAPTESARVAAAGQRGVAFEPRSSEYWESLDAGASWTSLGKLPVDPVVTPGAEPALGFACVARGCVFGETLSRIGWRGQPRSALLPPPDRASRRATPRVGTPYSCTLDPSEWRRIEGALAVPSAASAALGRVSWYVLRHDPATTLVETLSARPGVDTLEKTVLLGPGKPKQKYAYAAQLQIEGAVALRYESVFDRKDKDTTVRNVEIAWNDLLAGHAGHAVIPDAGAYRIGDVGDTSSKGSAADTSLVSIASGGVYVRLHKSLGDDQSTYFVDGKTVDVVPPVAWPSSVSSVGHAEMVHVGHTHVPLRLVDGTVVRATRIESGFTFDAVSLGASRPSDFGWEQETSVAYSGDKAGRSVTIADSQGKGAIGVLYPFRSTGAVVEEPIRIPTQLDLPAVPRPCSDRERKSTPRVVASSLPGTRHPVIVSDSVEPMRILLTDDAVLHGAPTSPCAAAFDANLVMSEASATPRTESAILPLDALDRSWIFRVTRSKSDKDSPTSIEYRPMSCKSDPGAEVPIEVFRERFTLIDPD